MRFSTYLMAALAALLLFAANPASAKKWKCQKTECYGAIAVSTYGWNAFGTESFKRGERSAYKSALNYCNKRHKDKGGDGKSCVARSSAEWTVGITCGPANDITLHSYAGDEPTAAAAANVALKLITSEGPSNCDVQAIRHGEWGGAKMEEREWFAKVRCNGVTKSVTLEGATQALNEALFLAGENALCNECEVIKLKMQ